MEPMPTAGPSGTMKKMCRPRGKNFTLEEQELLCQVAVPYLGIIESKKTDAVKQAAKQEAWGKITLGFNARTNHCPRNAENLMTFFRNLKAKMKKDQSDAKMLVNGR